MVKTQSEKPPLPTDIVLNREVSWDAWRLWRAFGRRIPPSQLLLEPNWLIQDILTLETAYAGIEESRKTDG